MRRIEDAPKELQDMFAVVWERIVCSASGISDYRDEIEHAFLKGFDIAMATTGLPERPKRTIVHLTEMGSHIYVLSTDGKLFRNHWATPQEWQALPDLPQED